jgi:hypothetical protein
VIAIFKKYKSHIVAGFFAILVGFAAFAPVSGLVVGLVTGIGLAIIAFFMVVSK